MFNKKIDIPLLSYFILKINLTSANKWIVEPAKISASPESEWKDHNLKEYKITLMPSETFTFFHNQANEFSPSIGGNEILQNEPIGVVEWGWNETHFYVTVSEPRSIILSVPLDEIFHLIKTGNNLSKNGHGEKEIISLGVNEYFNEIYRNRHFRKAITYSNDIASLTVIPASSSDAVLYECS